MNEQPESSPKRRSFPKTTCSLFSVVCFLTVTFASLPPAEAQSQISQQPHRKYDSYRGLVMTGYQGWFNADSDGAGKKWRHYSRSGKFEPGQCSIDFWPDMTEYDHTYETLFEFADGSPAYVFSSYDVSTVNLHFKWMADYGIDGAFMQRFIHKLKDQKVVNHYDVVFDSAIRAATKYKRAISVRYDLTGMKKGDSRVLLEDLDKLNTRYDFFERGDFPTFLHHKGKPLVAIGGVGLTCPH